MDYVTRRLLVGLVLIVVGGVFRRWLWTRKR